MITFVIKWVTFILSFIDGQQVDVIVEAESPPVAAKMAAWARGELPAGLTRREIEVLRLVAEGLSNREIARRLRVKERTVVFHESSSLKKLGVASRVEAAIWAKEHGIIS